MPKAVSPRFPLVVLAGLVLLVGCATPASVSVGETTTEVAARFPKPDARVKLADGGERWQYPSAPMGVDAYMIDFGPDGRVRSVTQALTPENFYKNLQPGLTKDQVRTLLGKPGVESWYPRLQQDVMTWRYYDIGEINPFRQLDVFFSMADGRLLYYTMTPDKAFDPGGGGERP